MRPAGLHQAGKFRAPKNPDNLDDFHWFCLDHVREYNLKWNFFDSHSDEDLERQFAADRVWGRPTRPFGAGGAARRHPAARRGAGLAALRLRRPDGAARRQGDAQPRQRAAARRQRRLPPTERRALEILDAQDTQTKAEIRKQYKALVKDLHPT